MAVQNLHQHLRMHHTVNLGIIISTFIVINIVLFLHYNIRIVNDTARYMEYSNAIIDQGIHFEKHNFWYIGYVLFITTLRQISDDPGLIVFMQVCISLLASVAIYFATYTLTQQKTYALIAALLYVCWLKISQWNFYMHPESLYASFSAFTISSIVFSLQQKKNYALPCLLAAITFWIKPTGFVSGAAFIVTLLFLFNIKK